MIEPVRPWDFVKVVSAKGVKGSGLEVGETVFVSSTKVVPEKKNDPYLQRVLVLVLRMDEGDVQIPSDDNDYKAYLVDPRSLEKLDKETTDALREGLVELYKAKEGA